MGIKNWFTKKSRVVVSNPANTTRLYDIYGETKDLDILKAKVSEIENLVNNLPPLPDLTGYYTKAEIDAKPYAKTNTSNTFTQSQIIKNDASFLSFTSANNTRRGYIGKASSTSNDISLVAETNSLALQAKHNVVINAGDGYGISINRIPTENNHIANKGYVDNAIANIPTPPPVDLSNVAKLNQINTFNEEQNFRANVDISNTLSLGQIPYYNGPTADKNVTLPLQFTTKEYVDSKVGFPKIYRKYYGSGTVNINKYDGPSGWYRYGWWTYITHRDFANKDILVLSKTQSLGSGDNRTFTSTNNSWNTDNTYVFTADANGRVQVSGECFSTVDLKYGGIGNFTGNFSVVECYLMIVEKVQL